MLQDTLTQAQEQVVAIAEEVAEVVAPVAETATEGAMGWSEMLMVALIGFLLVFVVLVLLIYVMRLMGWFFTRDRKPKAVAAASSEPALDHAISDQELLQLPLSSTRARCTTRSRRCLPSTALLVHTRLGTQKFTDLLRYLRRNN